MWRPGQVIYWFVNCIVVNVVLVFGLQRRILADSVISVKLFKLMFRKNRKKLEIYICMYKKNKTNIKV